MANHTNVIPASAGAPGVDTPRPPSWKQRNHEATPEEIAAVQAPFGTEQGPYPSEYAARLVLEVNGGNVADAVALFMGYLNGFPGTLQERIYSAATGDHDRGLSGCAMPYVSNAAAPKGGVNPKPPSGDTIKDIPQAKDVEEALAYADRGYTWRGTLALDDAALEAAKAELAGGIPTASTFRGFDLDAVKLLRCSGMISSLYASSDPWRDDALAPMSAAAIFAQQVLVSGGGRGPSGDAGATEAGPGVVS